MTRKLYKELKGATFENGARVGHIGASDVACMYGKGFKSPLQWAIEKRMELVQGAKPQGHNLLFSLGHAVESVVAEEFAYQHPGWTIDKGFEKDRIFERTDNPLFHCTPDRFYNKKKGLLEIKFDSMGKYYYNSPEDYKLNEGYLYQCQYQMWFFGIAECWLAWVNNHGGYGEFKLNASPKYGEKFETELPKMWEDWVLNANDPKVVVVEDCTICHHEDKPITATDEIRHAIEHLNKMEIEMKIRKNELAYDDKEFGYEALKDKVKMYMANNDVLLDNNGQVLATYAGAKRRLFKLKGDF